MSRPKKQNPVLRLEKSVKLSPVVVLDDIVKDNLIKQNPLVKLKGKGKQTVKRNPIFRQKNEGKEKKLVKRNPIFKQKNVKKKYQVHKEKAIEVSENKVKSEKVDISDKNKVKSERIDISYKNKVKSERIDIRNKNKVKSERIDIRNKNKVKSERIDISDRDTQNTVHSMQKDFSVLIKLRKEFENGNGLIEYTCQVCLEKHYSEESFIRHWYLHTVYDPREICVVCGQKIQKGRKFRNHVALKHPKHPYKCSTCSLVFKGPYEDKCHQLAHARMCNYFCSICGIGFEVFQVLEFHMFTAHVEGCKSMYSIDQDLVNTFFVKMEI